MKLYYFGIAGRAGAIRLMFNLSKTSFEDVTVSFEEWPEMKAKAPFGQMPWLELDDGTTLAQQVAIEDYVAKLTGFYPSDPWVCARGDEVRALVLELFDMFVPTIMMENAAEKKAKQEELIASSGKERLQYISKRLEAVGDNFLGGKDVSVADLALYSMIEFFTSGFFPGVKGDLLDSWPVLKKECDRVKAVLDAGPDARKAQQKGPRRRFLFFRRRGHQQA